VIAAIAGTAGVGKTTLAVHWAHRVAGRFSDGQLYANLRGFSSAGSPVSPADAVRGFLEALGVPPHRIPAGMEAQSGLYRSLLAGKRVLVLLDNAYDADQVRPLLPGSPGCLVLVTSRNLLPELVAAEGAYPLALDLPTLDEARQLLARRLDTDRVAAEPQAVEEIITRCARLPLALSIVAAHAAIRTRSSLGTLASELREAGGGLNGLASIDDRTDVRAVFSWSYRALTPAAARLFRLLGLHPGPDVSLPAAASLAGVPAPQARALVTELVGANLVVEPAPGRYAFHDLLRAYAVEQSAAVDPDQSRHAAVGRLLDHYLRSAYAAARLLHPARDPISLAPPLPGANPEIMSDRQQAVEFFTTEHRALLAAVDLATAAGFDTHTWQLAWTLTNFLTWRGHWHDMVTAGHAAVAATGRSAAATEQARAHRNLAQANTELGLLDEAGGHFRRALDISTSAADRTGQAHAHYGLAFLCARQENHGQALECARHALDLFRAVGHRAGQADALNAIGWCYASLGDHRQAIAYCREALSLSEGLGDRHGQAAALDSLGRAYHHLGQHAEAVTFYRRAVDLLQDYGDRYYEANALKHLGDTLVAAGDRAAAAEAWERALVILEDLDHPDAAKVRTRLARSG
jgi:tetratricopeptide (TPR) repeat protein